MRFVMKMTCFWRVGRGKLPWKEAGGARKQANPNQIAYSSGSEMKPAGRKDLIAWWKLPYQVYLYPCLFKKLEKDEDEAPFTADVLHIQLIEEWIIRLCIIKTQYCFPGYLFKTRSV